MDYLNLLGGYLRPYLTEISTALIACTLVMAGGEINAMLRRILRNSNFALRTVAFVLINAFGYGLIIVKATPYLSRTLGELEAGIMLAIILFCFTLIGLWAQRNRQI
ncbi:membrane protein [Vibrio tubiashii]|nr:membrane protein [Vibrio tubiashii]